MIRAFCFSLIAVFAVGMMVWRRRRMLIRLTWPADLGFYGMRGRVRQYFLHRGWTVRDKESSEFDFLVSKGAGDFIVRCYPSGIRLFQKALLDLSDIPNRHPSYSRKALLFVSAEEVPGSDIADALAKRVFAFHYKSLDSLTALQPASPQAVGELVAEMLSRRLDNSDSQT